MFIIDFLVKLLSFRVFIMNRFCRIAEKKKDTLNSISAALVKVVTLFMNGGIFEHFLKNMAIVREKMH